MGRIASDETLGLSEVEQRPSKGALGGSCMGIRQLANELQLSIGTVSRALNDRPDVNPETRARVKAAAARAGYVPNQSGRSLRSGRTGIVAAVIPTRGSRRAPIRGCCTVLEGARRTLRAPGTRPHRALPRAGRGPAREPAAHRPAPHRRRGHHQRDHRRATRALPTSRLPASTTSPSAAARASTTILTSTSTSRRWRQRPHGSSCADGHRRIALALQRRAAQLRDDRSSRP